MSDASKPVVVESKGELVESSKSAPIERADEPPVVARLVIEIRSDGRRTIARGAMEDASIGEKVAIQAEGTTPLALAMSLAKSIFSVPALASTAMKAMLAARRKRDEE